MSLVGSTTTANVGERERISELSEAADTNCSHVEGIREENHSLNKTNGHAVKGYINKDFNSLQKNLKQDIQPFDLLAGEILEFKTGGKDGSVFLTNFRLFVNANHYFHNVPISLIEYVEMRDPYGLFVHCKDGKVLRVAFDSTEDCTEWSRLISSNEASRNKLEDIFAFQHFAHSKPNNGTTLKSYQYDCEAAMYVNEIKRLGFNTKSIWRTTEINSKFEMCETYPKFHIVPKWITDKDLETIARFRSLQRFPSVVWRNQDNGAVITRSSQPELGWFGWRCQEDEELLSAIAHAAKLDSFKAGSNTMSASVNINLKDSTNTPSFLLVDARSYAAAVANRAKGGGCEYQEYYPNCEIQFMGLPNIHAIRKSFHGVRALCLLGQEQNNWYSALEATKWLSNLSLLLKSACTIVEAIDIEGRSTLVHCSDGWDRTPQLVSLAQLLLDPYYRTFQGFHVLVEREWFEFGHKFADRCGHSTEKDQNERSPVFFQWLDAIHQVMQQFPSAFEFNEFFLIKLLQHCYSCLYGNFLCNSLKERRDSKLHTRTKSIWSFLLSGRKDLINYLYDATSTKVLYPNHRMRCLKLWDNVFLGKSDLSSSNNLMDSSINKDKLSSNSVNEPTTAPLQNSIKTGNGHAVYEDSKNENGISSSVIPNPHEKSRLSRSGSKNLNRHLHNGSSFETDYVSTKEGKNSNESMSKINKNENESKEHIELDNFCDMMVSNHVTDDVTNKNETCECNESVSQETITEKGTFDKAMTDSARTLTGESNEHRTSLDDLCLASAYADPGLVNLDHRTNSMRRTHSSPDSPTLNRLTRTKSVPDVMAASACDMNKPYTSNDYKVCFGNNSYNSFIDEDGLTRCYNFLEERLLDIELRHVQELQRLQKKLDLERQARVALQQQLYRDGYTTPLDIQDDMLSLPDSVTGARSSISSISNEEGWEQVQFDDVVPTKWVPDHLSTSCYSCGFLFTIMYRKHHCRNCGGVFCDRCSSKKISVPEEQLYTPVRVCAKCYEMLSQQK